CSLGEGKAVTRVSLRCTQATIFHEATFLQTLSHFSHLRRTRSLNNLQDFHHLHQGDDTHCSTLP
ncbi:hypothetical protein, partial [Legionella steigerwaltii]